MKFNISKRAAVEGNWFYTNLPNHIQYPKSLIVGQDGRINAFQLLGRNLSILEWDGSVDSVKIVDIKKNEHTIDVIIQYPDEKTQVVSLDYLLSSSTEIRPLENN